jgi:hypothetical protein
MNKIKVKKLVFFNYDEMYDVSKYPLLRSIRKSSEESSVRNEDTMTPQERIDFRKELFPKKTHRVLTRNRETIFKRGLIYEVQSDVALRDFKQCFTFYTDKTKNEEKCFVQELEVNEKNMPNQLGDVFRLYQEVLNENIELKEQIQKTGKPSLSNDEKNLIKKEAISDFFTVLSKELFGVFKELNTTNAELQNTKIEKIKPIALKFVELMAKMKNVIMEAKKKI